MPDREIADLPSGDGPPTTVGRRSATAADHDLESLTAHFGKRVYFDVNAILQDPAVAEEVAQDTWLTVHRQLHNFRGECRIEHWIRKIAVRKAKKMQSRLRRGRDAVQKYGRVGRTPTQLRHLPLTKDLGELLGRRPGWSDKSRLRSSRPGCSNHLVRPDCHSE